MREEIAGLKNYDAGGGVAAENKAAGDRLLAGLEDDAKDDMAKALKKMEKKKNGKNADKFKQIYYDAVVRYEWISKELGPDSPAKAAAKAVKIQA